jgi:hypothetical protein
MSEPVFTADEIRSAIADLHREFDHERANDNDFVVKYGIQCAIAALRNLLLDKLYQEDLKESVDKPQKGR